MRFTRKFSERGSTLSRSAFALVAAALGSGAAVSVSADDLTLETITVTAQKREQSLQEVPMSVSALSANALKDAGVGDIEDISRQVPVLEVQSSVSPVQTNFRIRRVGNLGNIPTFEPAVGVFVDGAFRARSIFGATDLFDLERVEILRGPQSTLYGKNTTAGVIGFYTKKPADAFEWNGEVTLGSIEGGAREDAQSMNFKGGLSGPLTETVGASLGVAYSGHDATFGEALANSGSEANDQDRYSVRGQLSWEPTDAFSTRLILGAMREDDKQQTADITYDPNGPLSRLVLPAWRAAGVSDSCSDNDPHNRITCVNQPLTTDLKAEEATLLASYQFANGVTLNSVSSWDHFLFEGTMDDVAQMMAPLLRFHDKQESESLQQELRLNSATGQTVEWLAGAFYYTNEYRRGDADRPVFFGDTFSSHPAVSAVNQQLFRTPFPLPIAAPGQVGYLDSTLDTEYVGVYGQTTWNIGEAFSVTGGVRWQEENKKADIRQWVNSPAPSIVSLVLSPAAISATGLERDTSEVTWSLTPKWRVTDDAMLFATAAHGFKSGGFNTGFGRLPIAQREFGDEDIMHYEAGAKLDLLDGRMRLAASAFLTEFEDYQDAAFVGAQFTVGNAEKAELRGAELEGSWRLTQRLTTDFAVSYADLTYEKNTRGQCYPGRVSDSSTTPGACDLSGEHPVNAPEWKTHLGLQYDQPVSWGELFTRADWSWTDDYQTSFSADPRLIQPAYSWLNLRGGARWKDYEVVLWVENATNETVANLDAVVTLYAGDGSYQSLLQDARSYGLTFRVNY
jgi:iron complex outermembrane receptor protein